MKNNFLELTGRTTDHLTQTKSGDFIHHKVKQPFEQLQKKAKEEINADLQIVSSFRSFERQLSIWNAKATGQRSIKNDQGKILSFDGLSSELLLRSILRFSAIPGGSRHHWGSDIDIFDASVCSKDEVLLEPSECTPGGAFHKLHTWLDDKIKDNDACGFFRPYNADLGGVAVEKWHLSYRPVSENYNEQYNYEVFIQNLESSSIILKEKILENAQKIFKNYIKNISL